MSWKDILKGREEQDFYMDMYGTHTPQDAKRVAPGRAPLCGNMIPLGGGSYEKCENSLRTPEEKEEELCRECQNMYDEMDGSP